MKHNICPGCGKKGLYSSRFDTFVCPVCNTWLESQCSDPQACVYCVNRSEKPSDYYIRKPETFATMTGDAMELEHFKSMVVSGSIMPDDGSSGSIFVDGVDQINLDLAEFGMGPANDIEKEMVKTVSLDDLNKMFPGKKIHIEWLNK